MYESVSTAGPLPRGRHNLPPEQIEADQRRRMLAAMPVALAEHGYARATVAHVLERAGVSRRTFYQQFDDKEACLLAAYDEAERRARERARVAAAEAPAGNWEARVEAALAGMLGFVAAEPETTRLFTLEARAAGPAMAARHNRALDRIAAALRAGNRTHPADDRTHRDSGLPEGTERVLVGNVAALVGAYVLSGATELLPSLAPQLAGHLLSPYREEG